MSFDTILELFNFQFNFSNHEFWFTMLYLILVLASSIGVISVIAKLTFPG